MTPTDWYGNGVDRLTEGGDLRVFDDRNLLADDHGRLLVIRREDVRAGENVELVVRRKCLERGGRVLLDDADLQPARRRIGDPKVRARRDAVARDTLVQRLESSTPMSSESLCVTSAMSTLISTCGAGRSSWSRILSTHHVRLQRRLRGDQKRVRVDVRDDKHLSLQRRHDVCRAIGAVLVGVEGRWAVTVALSDGAGATEGARAEAGGAAAPPPPASAPEAMPPPPPPKLPNEELALDAPPRFPPLLLEPVDEFPNIAFTTGSMSIACPLFSGFVK